MKAQYSGIFKSKHIKIIILLFSLLVFINCGGKEEKNVSIKQNKEIDSVKHGVLEFDKTVTVGNALEGYKFFTKKEWKFAEDAQKRKTVEFLGTLNPADVYGNIDPKLREKLLSTVNECVFYVKFNMSADNQNFSVAGGGERIKFKNDKTYESNLDTESLWSSGKIQNIFQNKMISSDCSNQYLVERYIAFPITQEERDRMVKRYDELDKKVGELWASILAQQKYDHQKLSWQKTRDSWYEERDKQCNAKSGESTKLNCLIAETEQKIERLVYQIK